MVDTFCVSAIQMVSTDVLEDNLLKANVLISNAVFQGAQLVVLPENFSLMGLHSDEILQQAESLGKGYVQTWLANTAKNHNVWIVAGSFPLISPEKGRVYSSCLVYDSSGYQVAHYNKIHLFDVELTDKQESYCESKAFYPGDAVAVVETPFGIMGLSICYDLRFPELYRQLVDKGANFIVAPSAFTAITGQAHWQLLCRTRAVENQCYLIASNQGGVHTNGRRTYGHSMIVDPWGVVLAEAKQGADAVVATMDKSHVEKIRKTFPAIKHRRLAI